MWAVGQDVSVTVCVTVTVTTEPVGELVPVVEEVVVAEEEALVVLAA